jgi:hypothetical protein
MSTKNTVLRPWEKAVEHSFVLQAANKSAMAFALPLDGDAEVAGDSIFGAGTLCTLVEFKRDQDAVADEVMKFASRRQSGAKEDRMSDNSLAAKGYAHACTSLLGRGEYHYVVYGEWNFSSGPPVFELKARTYLLETEITDPVDSIINANSGWTELALANYVRDFVRIKLYGAPSENEGGDGERELYQNSDAVVDEIDDCIAMMNSTYIVGVSSAGNFMIPLPVAGPMLLKVAARINHKLNAKK